MRPQKREAHPSAWLALREMSLTSDPGEVRRVVESSRLFRTEEVEVAVELVLDHFQFGSTSDYRFLYAHPKGEPERVAGYTCFGEIACTVGSYDLYWIAVDDTHSGRGVGSWLLEQTETRIRGAGGRRVYIETSGCADYRSTQRFYLNRGYGLEAKLADFYRPGDPKLIYGKALGTGL